MKGRMWIAAGLAALVVAGPAAAQVPLCDPETECCVETCPTNPALPTTDECLADACSCARAIDCTITALEAEGALSIYPTTCVRELNTASSHGQYITMRVNDLALGTINEELVERAGPVDFPYGSIITKRNFLPDGNPEPPFRTSMVKLAGFCPPGDGVPGRGCNGGEWFWMIRRFGRYPFLNLNAEGKAPGGGKTGFCVGCHAASEKSDWSWRLFTRRRFPAPPDTPDCIEPVAAHWDEEVAR